MMFSILITGATGFVGGAVAQELDAKGDISLVATVRNLSTNLPQSIRQLILSDLLPDADYAEALENVNVVLHCAARVHMMDDAAAVDLLSEFRKVNVEGTLNLARQAARAGVNRFVFLSSVKVNGEMTSSGKLFQSDDTFVPVDPYGLSKHEAEQGLSKLAQETNMEVVIIRSPLVYGPGVKANFAMMMKWIYKGIPLPFGAIHNKRSLVALDNLVNFIIHCVDHRKAANEIFLISDGEDVSTTELLQKVAKAFGKKALLFPVPVNLMMFVAKLLGKGDIAKRLFGSLQVDSSKARELLGWKPVITMDEQLKKTADAYLNETTI